VGTMVGTPKMRWHLSMNLGPTMGPAVAPLIINNIKARRHPVGKLEQLLRLVIGRELSCYPPATFEIQHLTLATAKAKAHSILEFFDFSGIDFFLYFHVFVCATSSTSSSRTPTVRLTWPTLWSCPRPSWRSSGSTGTSA